LPLLATQPQVPLLLHWFELHCEASVHDEPSGKPPDVLPVPQVPVDEHVSLLQQSESLWQLPLSATHPQTPLLLHWFELHCEARVQEDPSGEPPALPVMQVPVDPQTPVPQQSESPWQLPLVATQPQVPLLLH
jgi:hypothetical protein